MWPEPEEGWPEAYYDIGGCEDVEPRGPWKVSTRAYYYTIETSGTHLLPAQEILGYHWHPEGRNTVRYPHLHLYHGAGTFQYDLLKAHLPTGRIAIRHYRE